MSLYLSSTVFVYIFVLMLVFHMYRLLEHSGDCATSIYQWLNTLVTAELIIKSDPLALVI